MDTAPNFQLDNIIINSYIRQVDPKTQISAQDMAYAISSLLESPQVLDKNQIVNSVEQDPKENKNPNYFKYLPNKDKS